jgi:hypothetical protein
MRPSEKSRSPQKPHLSSVGASHPTIYGLGQTPWSFKCLEQSVAESDATTPVHIGLLHP